MDKGADRMLVIAAMTTVLCEPSFHKDPAYEELWTPLFTAILSTLQSTTATIGGSDADNQIPENTFETEGCSCCCFLCFTTFFHIFVLSMFFFSVRFFLLYHYSFIVFLFRFFVFFFNIFIYFYFFSSVACFAPIGCTIFFNVFFIFLHFH